MPAEKKKKKRSPSKADRDPKIVAIKALRDSIADKEAAGLACKGLFACYKSGDNSACLKKMHDALTALKAKESKTKGAGPSKRRGRSRSRSRSRSRK